MACLSACAVNAITGKKNEVHVINQDKCTKCGTCFDGCKFDAVVVE